MFENVTFKYWFRYIDNLDIMTVLKRRTERSAFSMKATNLFLSAALFVSCAGVIDSPKVTSMANPPVKTQVDPSAEEMEKKAHLEKVREWLRRETELERRKNAAGVLTEYDRNDSKTLDTLEYCRWFLVSYGYILPRKKQNDGAPEFDALALPSVFLLEGCVKREEEKFGKRELGVEDIIKLLP